MSQYLKKRIYLQTSINQNLSNFHEVFQYKQFGLANTHKS